MSQSLGTGLLLPYQQRLLDAMLTQEVTVCEKSRRIGVTWASALGAVITSMATASAGGMDTFYIGYNQEMTREFIDTAAKWAKGVAQVAVEEFIFRDGAGDDTKHIQAFRISFASGFEIVALCSRPRSLRGRQGLVIIDEAAFHEQLLELLKAALALLMWGGRVLVISTHDGAENVFNELVNDILAGKFPYCLLRITFSDALSEGLYSKICEATGKDWTPEAEREWEAKIRKFYGDAAGEELDCVPRQSGGRYLSRVLLESRAVDVPVLRWQMNDAFVDLSDSQRYAVAQDWIQEHLDPLLDELEAQSSYLGEDFGRSGDLTILWPVLLTDSLKRKCPFIVELRNIPFREQEQIVLHVCKRLPGFCFAALDARGNGQYLAERVRQIYGPQAVAEVMLTEGWYRDNWPKLKDALEDDRFEIPAHPDVVNDFRTVEVVRGVPRVVERTKETKGEGKDKGAQRHGDAAIAAVLAMFASLQEGAGPFEIYAAGERAQAYDGNDLPGERDDYDLPGGQGGYE